MLMNYMMRVDQTRKHLFHIWMRIYMYMCITIWSLITKFDERYVYVCINTITGWSNQHSIKYKYSKSRTICINTISGWRNEHSIYKYPKTRMKRGERWIAFTWEKTMVQVKRETEAGEQVYNTTFVVCVCVCAV